MQKAQVLLRDDQKAELARLSRQTGRKQSELIRRGVDLAIAEVASEVKPDERSADANTTGDPAAIPDWKKAWLDAAGIWADRDDIDELYADIRRRGRERMERLEKQWREP